MARQILGSASSTLSRSDQSAGFSGTPAAIILGVISISQGSLVFFFVIGWPSCDDSRRVV
jgi:hypothetical protein